MMQKLSHKEMGFAAGLAEGLSNGKAYRRIAPHIKSTSCRKQGMILSRNPDVQAKIKELRSLAWEQQKLSYNEKLAFLADLVRRSPATCLNDDGGLKKEYAHLIQEAVVTKHPDGSTTTKIKFPSKLEAVRIDNIMQGHDAPIKIEGTLTLSDLVTQRIDALPNAEEKAELEALA